MCIDCPQAFNLIAQPIKQVISAGYKIDSRVLDVNNVDVSCHRNESSSIIICDVLPLPIPFSSLNVSFALAL